MPLRNPHPKLWHWQQAIGWIAFDVVDPPPQFNIFNPDVTSKYPRREERRLRINKAIGELLEAAESAIQPIWLNNEPAVPLNANAARQMYNILDRKCGLPPNHLMRCTLIESRYCNTGPKARELHQGALLGSGVLRLCSEIK